MSTENNQKKNTFSRLVLIVSIVIIFIVFYFSKQLSVFLSKDKLTSLIGFNSCENNKGRTDTPPSVVSNFKWNKAGIVTLWFDDGWATQYTTAYPIMQQENLKGAIAIATNFVCRPEFVTWNQLRILQNNGWETTAHTISHNCDLQYYNKDTTLHEIAGSRKIIQDHGLRADQFVMPCGFSSADFVNLYGEENQPPILSDTKQYFHSYRSTKSKRINMLPIADPYNLNAFMVFNNTNLADIQDAINDAIDKKGWLIIVFHQIDYTDRAVSIPVTTFQQIINLVKDSNLQVVLPSQALSIK